MRQVKLKVAFYLTLVGCSGLGFSLHAEQNKPSLCEATKIIEQCVIAEQAANSITTDQAVAAQAEASTLGDIPSGASLMEGVSGNAAFVYGKAQEACEKVMATCKKIECLPPGDPAQRDPQIKKCQKGVAGIMARITIEIQSHLDNKTAAGRTKDAATGGGMSDMLLGGAIGAGVGVLGGYLISKKTAENKAAAALAAQNQVPVAVVPPQYGALQPNGTVNCAMGDAYQFTDCDQYNIQACANVNPNTPAAVPLSALPVYPGSQPIVNAPTVATGPNCAAFTARYCSSTVTPPTAYANHLVANGPITQVNVGGSGGGIGSLFCSTLQANSYCSNPVYGAARSQCPTCRQMTTAQSPTCQANPALCIADSSPAQVAQAKVSCPDDPVFSNPNSPYVLSTATVVPVGITGKGGAAVILPQSAGISTGIDNSPSKTSAQTPVKTIQAVNAAPATPVAAQASTPTKAAAATTVAGALREGQTGYTGASTSGSSGGGVSTGYSLNSASDRMAGSAAAIKTASARGPASDVEGPYGPSLFTTSTQVIRQRCDAGKIDNCP